MSGFIQMQVCVNVVDHDCVIFEENDFPERIFKYSDEHKRWLMARLDPASIGPDGPTTEAMTVSDEEILIERYIDVLLRMFINGPEAKQKLEELATDEDMVNSLIHSAVWVGQCLCMLYYLGQMGEPKTKEELRKVAEKALRTNAKYYIKNVVEQMPETLAPVIERLDKFKISSHHYQRDVIA